MDSVHRPRTTAEVDPDRRRDARATAAVAVQFAVNGAFFASFVPRLPELRDELGISTRAIGILLTVASASGLLASLAVRGIVARFGTRRVLFGGGVVIAASLVLVGVAGSWPLALVGLLGMFACDVLVDVSMNMQGSWLSSRRRRPIMNRLHGLWSLGSAVGGVVASTVAGASVSLTVHLVIAACVLVVMSSIVVTQLLPVDEVHAAPAAVEGVPAAPGFSRVRFFVAGLTAVAIEMAAMSWAAFRITDDLDGSASVAALAYVAVAGGQMVARFAGDHLAHRFGSDALMRGSAVLAISSIVAAALVGVEALVVAAFLFAGFGLAALAPRLYDLAARAGGGSASGLGVLTAGIRTATIIVPASVAAVASATSVGTALAVAAVVAGVGFLASTTPR